MHKLLLLFDLLCSYEHSYSWAYSWAVCHLLSTVTQVSNQIISLYMQWPMVRKMTRSYIIRLIEKNVQIYWFVHIKENTHASWRGKMISTLIYAYRLWRSVLHENMLSQKYCHFVTEGFFSFIIPQVLFIAISIYFWTTLGCEQLLNDAVKHVHATVFLKWNGLWLQLVSLTIYSKWELKQTWHFQNLVILSHVHLVTWGE